LTFNIFGKNNEIFKEDETKAKVFLLQRWLYGRNFGAFWMVLSGFTRWEGYPFILVTDNAKVRLQYHHRYLQGLSAG
jgi:hypothetical protein